MVLQFKVNMVKGSKPMLAELEIIPTEPELAYIGL